MIINQTVSGGGTTPTGKYQLLQRIKDDNNNEIGTVAGFRKDANGNEYAVVSLDRTYQTSVANFCSNSGTSFGVTLYDNLRVYSSKDTATQTCDTILAKCISMGWTSEAITAARALSFSIDGVTYYGQVPTINELIQIYTMAPEINDLDPTGDLVFASTIMSSTQNSNVFLFCLNNNGSVTTTYRTYGNFMIPILELPNA